MSYMAMQGHIRGHVNRDRTNRDRVGQIHASRPPPHPRSAGQKKIESVYDGLAAGIPVLAGDFGRDLAISSLPLSVCSLLFSFAASRTLLFTASPLISLTPFVVSPLITFVARSPLLLYSLPLSPADIVSPLFKKLAE